MDDLRYIEFTVPWDRVRTAVQTLRLNGWHHPGYMDLRPVRVSVNRRGGGAGEIMVFFGLRAHGATFEVSGIPESMWEQPRPNLTPGFDEAEDCLKRIERVVTSLIDAWEGIEKRIAALEARQSR